MKKQIKISFFFTLISTVTLGIVYPLALTAVGFVIPSFSSPSLLAQPLQRDDLFHGRPSMSGGPYSGASNLSFTSLELSKQVDERLKRFTKDCPGVLIPHDLLFASASGYDPDISIEAARFQISRIAKARNMESNELRQLVNQHTQSRFLGFIGTEKVNVIWLNKALEILVKTRPSVAP